MEPGKTYDYEFAHFLREIPCGLAVRIRRSHRRGRGSTPRMGVFFFHLCNNCLILNTNIEENKQAPPQAPPAPLKVELLEKALEKARDVRNFHESVELTSKSDSKTRATVQRSLQLAKTAYAPPSNPTKSKSQACKKRAQKSRRTFFASANKKAVVSSAKPKPHTRAHVTHKQSGMDLKLATPVAGSSGGKGMSSPGGGFAHTVHLSGAQACEQPLLTSSCKAVQCEPRTSSDASSGQFRIQTDG